jgi:hypothetical protein
MVLGLALNVTVNPVLRWCGRHFSKYVPKNGWAGHKLKRTIHRLPFAARARYGRSGAVTAVPDQASNTLSPPAASALRSAADTGKLWTVCNTYQRTVRIVADNWKRPRVRYITT